MNYEFVLDRSEAKAAARPDDGLEHIDMRPLDVEDGARTIVGEIAAVVRRRARGIGIWVLACVAIASIYLVTAKPEFLAATQVVLESRQQVPLGSDPSSLGPAPALDIAQADSQLQVIKSGRNLRFVFERLKLESNPAYLDPGPGPILSVIQSLLASIPFMADTTVVTPEEKARIARERAFQTFSDQVAVKRLGQSYVMEISFRALSPGDAARLANSVTMAYIRDQVLFKAASDQRGAQFLQGRISVIETEKQIATEAVDKGIIPDFQFPDSDARVVSAALEPLTKAYPQTKLILLLAVVFGLVSGITAATIHNGLDRKIRSREQIRRALGVDCLGAFPQVRSRRARHDLSYSAALERPNSEFARTLRTLRTALFSTWNGRRGVAIGVVSCLPGEGKSTIAANLAQLLAASQDRVVLIDADLQNPSMSRRLAPNAQSGLNDLLLGGGARQGLPEIALTPNLSFVPAAREGRTGDPNAFFGSHGMQEALARLDGDRDVIFDLPAMNLSSDAQAIGHLLTGVVLIAAVNRTTLDQLSEAIRALRAANVRILGIVLNNLDQPRKARADAPAPAARPAGQAA